MTVELRKPNLSLEMDAHTFTTLSSKVVARLAEFIQSLDSLPVTTKITEQDTESFRESLPQQGANFDVLLSRIFDIATKGGHQFHSPGYQCYIPTGGLLEPSLAEIIVSVLNRFVGLKEWAPAVNEIEKTVVSWLIEIVGMPKNASGILTSGGSMANFTAVFVARHHKLSDSQIASGVIYSSSQAHHSLIRAGFMCGIPRSNFRFIDVDAHCRIDLVKLESQIVADKKSGLKPFLIVGMAGTTASGAVDDLSRLESLARKYEVWFHVDAAWAGGFRMIECGENIFKGIEKADSVTIDPHKALFLPMGSGALLVKDWSRLENAHAVEIAYLPNDQDDFEYNPCKGSLELLRPSRGLQLWLPLKMHGMKVFKEYHEEKMALARYAWKELKKISGIEILHEPQVAVVVFRISLNHLLPEDLNRINQRLIELVNDSETKISGAQFGKDFWARIVPFGLRTHKIHVDRTLRRIQDAVLTLCNEDAR